MRAQKRDCQKHNDSSCHHPVPVTNVIVLLRFPFLMPGPLIYQKFELQAGALPHALAVIDSRRAITYGELNATANRLARRLVDFGVRPGQFVGVWAERSIETVVHLLAVVKAGGTYL